MILFRRKEGDLVTIHSSSIVWGRGLNRFCFLLWERTTNMLEPWPLSLLLLSFAGGSYLSYFFPSLVVDHENTWENFQDIHRLLPNFHHDDKVRLIGGGVDGPLNQIYRRGRKLKNGPMTCWCMSEEEKKRGRWKIDERREWTGCSWRRGKCLIDWTTGKRWLGRVYHGTDISIWCKELSSTYLSWILSRI